MPTAGKVLVVGGAVEDVSLTVPSRRRDGQLVLPAREKLIATKTDRSVGGGGVTLGIALAKLGYTVRSVVAIGRDDGGRTVVQTLRAAGVQVGAATKTAATGLSAVLRPERGTDHWIIEDRGANDRLTWRDVEPHLSRSLDAVVLSQLSGASHAIIARLARELPKGVPLVWSPGTTQVARGVGAARPLLKRTAVLVLNDRELGEWFGGRQGTAAQHRAVDELLRLGVQVVVITQGRRGATAFVRSDGGKQRAGRHVRSFARRVVDKVGAGDAFVAGFTAAWLRWCDVERALVAGSLSAAATLAVPGALGGLMTWRELAQALARARRG